MKLTEIKSLRDMIDEKPLSARELAQWCQAHHSHNPPHYNYTESQFEEVSPGVFDTSVWIDVVMHEDDELPVKFRHAKQGFTMKGGKSLKGCPDIVQCHF